MEQLLKIKCILILVLLFGSACSGGQLTGQSTIDSNQKLVGSECPPQEICAPESDLEEIALTYLKALILEDCDRAAEFWLPERRDRAREHCTSGRLLPYVEDESCQLVEFSSKETRIEQLGEGFSAHLSGEFLFECDQETESYGVDDLILFYERREGDWYIAGFNS